MRSSFSIKVLIERIEERLDKLFIGKALLVDDVQLYLLLGDLLERVKHEYTLAVAAEGECELREASDM